MNWMDRHKVWASLGIVAGFCVLLVVIGAVKAAVDPSLKRLEP